MLDSLEDLQGSLTFFLRSTKRYEELYGDDHAMTAASYHALAKAYTRTSDFRTALNYERKTFNILLKAAGAEDPRTQEADKWLQELTQAAVTMAKREKTAGVVKPAPKSAAASVQQTLVMSATNEDARETVRFLMDY